MRDLRSRMSLRSIRATSRAPHAINGVGFSGGGATPNELAVMQVIEKLPVEAISATRLSTPMAFSAAA